MYLKLYLNGKIGVSNGFMIKYMLKRNLLIGNAPDFEFTWKSKPYVQSVQDRKSDNGDVKRGGDNRPSLPGIIPDEDSEGN